MALAAVVLSCSSTTRPSPSATGPTSAPSGPPIRQVWQRVDAFPPPGTVLSAIAAGGVDGLVIAGSAEAPVADCATRREPRLWTSADGWNWTEAPIEDAGNATADMISAGSQTVLVIGSTGSPGCPGIGPAVWSAGGNAHVLATPIDGLDSGDRIIDLVALDYGTDFIASGYAVDSGNTMGVWRVRLDATGSHWRAVAGPPEKSAGRSTLLALARHGDMLVGFDAWRAPSLWYSLDAGETWAGSDFTTLLGLQAMDSDFGANAFVMAGRACCALPDQQFGSLLRSTDGRTWAEARPTGVAFAQPIEAVVATDAGWIALGEQTYLSADGSDWRLGPSLPGYVPSAQLVNGVPVPFRLRAASGGRVVVAMTPTGVWRASLDDLVADLWPAAAPAAARPSVGETFVYTLQTHCGPTSRTVNFDRRSWLPDLPEGYFPLSYDYFYEHGTLAYVAPDRLEFTGAKGDVVAFVPTNGPPRSSLCH